MTRQLTILAILLLRVLTGFGQTDTAFTKADRYKTKKFDVAIWSKDKDDPEKWLKGRIMVLDGGSYYWNVKLNLDKGVLFDLDINGYA